MWVRPGSTTELCTIANCLVKVRTLPLQRTGPPESGGLFFEEKCSPDSYRGFNEQCSIFKLPEVFISNVARVFIIDPSPKPHLPRLSKRSCRANELPIVIGRTLNIEHFLQIIGNEQFSISITFARNPQNETLLLTAGSYCYPLNFSTG